MAYIDLGDDTNINVDLSSTTPINTELPDINYIPGYKEAEEERRANEVIRQENEVNRIALYDDMEYKKETDYYRGRDGAIQYIAGTNIEITDDNVINCTGGSNETSWGDITGTLANQTDLKNALDSKTGFSDFATNSKAGVIKMGSGTSTDSNGYITPDVRTYSDYNTSGNTLFISKGTLENVITGKKLTKDHLSNITSQVDTDYRVNFLSSRNLFNKAIIVEGKYIGDDGTIGTLANVFYSDYIEVKPNTKYSISGKSGSWTVTALYDINKNFISRVNDGDYITTTADTYYIITMGNPTYKDTIMVEQGDIASPYEPFIPNTINVNNEKYTDTINVGTDINSANRVNVLYSHNLFDKDNVNVLNAFISTQGVITANANNRSVYVSCKPNTTYTITRLKPSSGNNRFAVGYTDELPADSVQCDGFTRDDSKTSITITTDTNAKYICVWMWVDDFTITWQQSIDALQIEKGSTATTYEPYITPSIVVDNEKILYAIQNINFSINTNYVYDTASDFNVKCLKIGKTVVLALSTIAFKTSDIPNYGILISGLPKATSTKTFYLNANVNNTAPFRVSVATDGNLKRHWTNDPISGDSVNKQYYGFLVYDTTD